MRLKKTLQLMTDEVDCGVKDNDVALQSDVGESDQENESLVAGLCKVLGIINKEVKEPGYFLNFMQGNINLGRR
jgi:hypothetical protein